VAATSAPAVKAALLTLMRATGSLSDVQLEYAHPGATIQQEYVFYHKTSEREKAAALGRKRRDEDYVIELIVGVARDGNDAQAAEERCWAIVSIIENLVRLNPGQAGDVMEGIVSGWVVWGGAEMTPLIEAGQRLAEAVCRVEVKHRK